MTLKVVLYRETEAVLGCSCLTVVGHHHKTIPLYGLWVEEQEEEFKSLTFGFYESF